MMFANESDEEPLHWSPDPKLIYDLETFLYAPLTQIAKQCLNVTSYSRRMLFQKAPPKTKQQLYYRKVLNNRLALFSMLDIPKLTAIDGKKYILTLHSERINRLNPQKMICRICEKEILLSHLEEHNKLCSQRANYRQELNQLNEELLRIQEESSMKEVELITKVNLYNRQQRQSSKNLSHQNSPVMHRPAQQVTLSRFATHGDRPVRQMQRARTINLSDETPQIHRYDKRQLTRTFDNSPDNSKPVKSAIALLKVLQKYTARVLLADTSVEPDVKFLPLFKLGLLEVAAIPDVHQLVSQSLALADNRIALSKRLHKLDAQIANLGHRERIKRAFQKGISNSFKLSLNKTSTSTTAIPRLRVMDHLHSRSRYFKEDHSEETGTSLEQRRISIQLPDSDDARRQNSFQSQDEDEDQSNPLLLQGYFSDSGTLIQQQRTKVYSQRDSIGLRDFEFIDVLGVGAFGAVWKVRKLKTNDIYAMKVIDTRQIANKNLLKTLKAEKDIFQVIEGDFVAKAYYSFSQADCLFYTMEYVRGGDFDSILRKYGALDEPIARFYLAELLLAIQALHSKHIIHRDLKPENILLDHHGHIKLTDFGLSEFGVKNKFSNSEGPSKALQLQEQIQQKIRNFSPPKSPKLSIPARVSLLKHRVVGTPDYIAPEVIQQQSYINESIDLWSLGILAYEFLVGIPPFNDDSPEKIFENILNRQIEWPQIGDGPDELSAVAKDFIERLLDMNYKTRMTVEEALKHRFFSGINFETIRSSKAPLTPDEDPDDLPLMKIKKQLEKEKMSKLLKDTSSENSTFSRLRVDNLLRLDLLVDLNQKKANQLRRRKY